MWPLTKKPEPQAYETQTTRVFKGKVAPQGKIYLITKYKDKNGSYQAYMLANTLNLKEETKKIIFKQLFLNIKKKYGV